MTTRRRAPSVGHRRGAAAFAAVLAACALAGSPPVGALTAADVLVSSDSGIEESTPTTTVDPDTGEVLATPSGPLDDPLDPLAGALDGIVVAVPLLEGDAAPADEGGSAPAPSSEAPTEDDPSAAAPGESAPSSNQRSGPEVATAEARTASATGGVIKLRPALPSGLSPVAVPAAGDPGSTAGGSSRSLTFRPDAGLTKSPAGNGSGAASARRSTAPIVDLLAGLDLTPAQLAKVLAPFPVAGRASYSDDWGLLRHGPGALMRTHEGTDIFAASGTPVIASTSGVVTDLGRQSGLAGTSLRLKGPDGTEYFYAHLAAFHEAITDGGRVSKGQVLGFVGSTGNASTTSPHLHFEIRPRGGAAVPPVPFLDRWLAEATATAQTLERAPDGTLSIQVAGARRSVLSASPATNDRAAAGSTASAVVHHMANAASLSSEAASWGGVLVAGGLLAWFGWKLPASRRRRPATAPVANEPVGGLLDLG